jgi:hypothetical protein
VPAVNVRIVDPIFAGGQDGRLEKGVDCPTLESFDWG